MRRYASTLIALLALTAFTSDAWAQRSGGSSNFPPFEEVSKDHEQVISTAGGGRSLYTIYVNKQRHRAIAELPPNFEGQRIFIATTIAGGSRQTGHQWTDTYAYWTRHDDQLVLMEPNIRRQARGGPRDAELRSAVERTYQDRVLLSTKILCMGPNRGPVIDLNDLLIRNSRVLTGLSGNAALARIGDIKAFPQNVEIPVTIPMDGGELTTLHYSISTIPRSDYKPREADERVGYFMTVFKDFTRHEAGGDQFVRYINRWHLQKRDPQLRLSPPVEPIIFYIEHTVPVRYRRYVREGILDWNKAFERIGIVDAIEVRQQDARTGAYMDIYPEDVRYNFFRWISSERAFAMGPSRVNPETGQILDANIIFDDSMLKLWAMRYKEMVAAYGLQGLDPETLRFMEERPLWDPIARFDRVDPEREAILSDPDLTDDQKADLLGEPIAPPRSRLMTRVVQQSHHCDFGHGAVLQMQTANLAMQLMADTLMGKDVEMIDGVPEDYLGAMLKYVVSHEVGHTLGLRHNFKAASWLSLEEIAQRRGQPQVSSVMDYAATFIPPTPDTPRGDWATPSIGPYDYWAIEHGYTLDEKRRAELLKQVAQPEYQYATDEDRSGPDPYVDVWILGSDPMEWARVRLELVNTMREKLLDKAVEDGQPWYLLRRAYEQLLGEHLGALRVASRFVGGVHVNRDRKGDPENRDPMTPVDPARQREALKFVIDNAFDDAKFDVRPEVLRKLTTNRFSHWGAVGSGGDVAFPIHDRIAQIQSFAMLYLMNPGTLGRVYDNEMRTPHDEDALTLTELLSAVVDSVFTEFDGVREERVFTDRQPMISSLRRNLQSELVDRLIDLSSATSRMPRPVQTLCMHHLRRLDERLQALLKTENTEIDSYTHAHLKDLNVRIDRALNAVYMAR
ncbi:MAG TPA: zinc-dependent metalloprotease [Phycisphaerales bacterium]|nr:zinc-dependent metalloprotease [Phycisphaerales bacterium]HRQ76425.1 zinc-dependent metalloprotease [Phycisphaerales bacterium]